MEGAAPSALLNLGHDGACPSNSIACGWGQPPLHRKKFKQKITRLAEAPARQAKKTIGVGTSTGKTFVPFVAFCSICPNLIRGTTVCRPGISSPPLHDFAISGHTPEQVQAA